MKTSKIYPLETCSKSNKLIIKTIEPQWWQTQILAWYHRYGRHDLPWQHPKTPYRVWLAEIMLQQTQVKTVIPYYERFLKRFPTLIHLAEASLDDVLALWAGLGYYARARNLHKTAQIIANAYGGEFPRQPDVLVALPGIGQSTAHAILAQSHNQPLPILDGNVKRVLCRFHGIDVWPDAPTIKNQLWQLAEHYMPQQQADAYTQAMMDLGATCCTRTQPNCPTCPLQTHCLAWQFGEPHAYPGKKVTKTKPVRQQHFLILSHRDQVLLYPRPLNGLWGGLWSLPEFSSRQERVKWLSQYYAENYEIVMEKKGLKHEFTHFTLHYTGLYCMLRGKKSRAPLPYHWLSPAARHSRGLPKPIQQLVAILTKQPKCATLEKTSL